MAAPDGLPILGCGSAGEWESWLAEHHADSAGVWLRIAKAGSGRASVSYSEAVDGALRWGWIDGRKGRLDDDHWLQRFTPRRARSRWSRINRERAAALIGEGRMAPPGLAEVERARTDGRWEAAYAGQRTAAVPDDLRAALEENDRAAAFFATLDAANRYAILYRIHDAKRPETRARRIERFVGMLAEHRKLHP
jgi:uncharacterized protein YdeI (YjbR/CyaY-like superfamily)